MFSTTEVRWFLPGIAPARIWRWFEGETEQSSRTDYYLHIPDSDALGIKLREGRIEAKQRVDQQVLVCFGERAVGYVEQWRKWSFAAEEASGMIAELSSDSSSWIGVDKERKVCTYQVANGAVVAVSGHDFLDQGCAWEVAQVRLETTDAQWWSIGFEAFGAQAERGNLLRVVAKHFLEMDAAPTLTINNSYSYPKLLMKEDIQ